SSRRFEKVAANIRANKKPARSLPLAIEASGRSVDAFYVLSMFCRSGSALLYLSDRGIVSVAADPNPSDPPPLRSGTVKFPRRLVRIHQPTFFGRGPETCEPAGAASPSGTDCLSINALVFSS